MESQRLEGLERLERPKNHIKEDDEGGSGRK